MGSMKYKEIKWVDSRYDTWEQQLSIMERRGREVEAESLNACGGHPRSLESEPFRGSSEHMCLVSRVVREDGGPMLLHLPVFQEQPPNPSF